MGSAIMGASRCRLHAKGADRAIRGVIAGGGAATAMRALNGP